MRLGKTQKYAIQYLLNENKTSTEIAKELGLDAKDVEKFAEKNSNTNKENTVSTTSAKVTSKDLMINKTQQKQVNNVSIMTREAAEMNDAFKKNIQTNKSSEGIFRPKQ